jgi:hypothetical protein
LQELAAEVDHDQQAGQVEPVARRQQQRLAADLADSLPKAISEPEKVTAPIRMPM